MDSLRGLPAVPGSVTVQERRGSQRQADAFRRAMQQGGQGAPPAPPPGDEQPVRPPLQPKATAGRKNEGTACHVDVIA
jgi:hypothetical protein